MFSQRILLSLHSKFLCSLLREQGQAQQAEDNNLLVLSVPSSGKSVRLLLRLITSGVTVSFSREELRETEKIAKILGIQISRSIIKKLKIPCSDILSYSKRPVKIKIENIKPNMIEMRNPAVDDLDILNILDEEIEVVDPVISSDSDPMAEFPDTKRFRSKMFSEKIRKLKDVGLVFERSQRQSMSLSEDSAGVQFLAPKAEQPEEFAPGFLLSDDISSSQSDSGSVTLAERERKQTKRKLYAESPEPRELPERKKLRLSGSEMERETLGHSSSQRSFYCASCECGLANGSPSQSSPRTPRTSVQRELYNSCDDCVKRRVENNIKSIKQKKYFQMLKDKRAEAEKYKGQKFPCNRCDYVAAIPSNLKTHQMANHDGENFVDNYINEYFEKNKFLIL